MERLLAQVTQMRRISRKIRTAPPPAERTASDGVAASAADMTAHWYKTSHAFNIERGGIFIAAMEW
jgi:hypothetical protein